MHISNEFSLLVATVFVNKVAVAVGSVCLYFLLFYHGILSLFKPFLYTLRHFLLGLRRKTCLRLQPCRLLDLLRCLSHLLLQEVDDPVAFVKIFDLIIFMLGL